MIIEGKNAVREALNGEATIERIAVLKGYTDAGIGVLISKAKQKGIRMDYLDKKAIERYSASGHHQGIIAFVSEFLYSEVEEILDVARQNNRPHLIIILDGIEDPHNLGSIIRAAECMGADGIIIPNRRSAVVNETVVRTSSGATQYVKVAKVTNINQVIDYLKDQFIKIIAVDMEGTPIYGQSFVEDIALIIGGEGKGIKELTKNKADKVISIPMYGNVLSMNASVAAGVVLYEVRRQRG